MSVLLICGLVFGDYPSYHVGDNQSHGRENGVFALRGSSRRAQQFGKIGQSCHGAIDVSKTTESSARRWRLGWSTMACGEAVRRFADGGTPA